MNLGLKFQNLTLFTRIESNFSYCDVNTLLVDYNYYLHPKGWAVSPFVELGAGLLCSSSTFNKYLSGGQTTSHYISNYNTYTIPIFSPTQIIAIGVELYHVRLSLEYMVLLPEPQVSWFYQSHIYGNLGNEGDNSEYIGPTQTTSLLFKGFSLNLGFYLGGGSWKKSK